MIELAFAVSQPDDITDDHFKKLEMHDFNREDTWDLASITAFYDMVNFLVHFIDIIPNRGFYSMDRNSDTKHIEN